MTDEQFNELERHVEMIRVELVERTGRLAESLRDVTEALVGADEALSQRIDAAESVLRLFGDDRIPPWQIANTARKAYFPEAPAAAPGIPIFPEQDSVPKSESGFRRWFRENIYDSGVRDAG